MVIYLQTFLSLAWFQLLSQIQTQVHTSTSKSEKEEEEKRNMSHVQVVEFEVSLSEMGVMTPILSL